jgi:nucleotide-binding universal stress UspA family protein
VQKIIEGEIPMLKIKKILFPTDYSECANQAMQHALHLAWKYQAELHLLHAITLHGLERREDLKGYLNIDELYETFEKSSHDKMRTSIDLHKADKLPIKTVQERGIYPATVILEYAAQNDIDLIIMGTHGRRGFGHMFLGSVAEEVVRMAPCPVLTVREQEESIPVQSLKNILVPLDFSGDSKLALKYAISLAETSQAKLQLLHVVEQDIHPSFYVTGKTSIFDFNPDIIKKSEQVMQKYLDELNGQKIKSEFFVIEGRAAHDIIQFADSHQTDMIVIPTHGLTGIEHLMLGSVAEKVVRMAPCKVFTIKSFGKSLL